MYFRGSENIASNHPELRSLVEDIDRQLSRIEPGGVVHPDDWAGRLNEDPNRVMSVLSMLGEEGVLEEETRIECPNCDTQHLLEDLEKATRDEEVLHCSYCDRELYYGSVQTVSVFRVCAKLDAPLPGRPSVTRDSGQMLSESNMEQSIPTELLKDPFSRAPLLAEISERILREQGEVLEPFYFIILLHFLSDFIPFIVCLEKLGLRPESTVTFYKDYQYPQRDAVAEWLRGRGYRVASRKKIEEFLSAMKSTENKEGGTIILEDGGHISYMVQSKLRGLFPIIRGAVEQTTRGIMSLQDLLEETEEETPGFPVLSVASCELKGSFEPPHVAEAVIRNLNDLLPDISIRGSNVAILGFGTIGNEAARQLRSNGANVTVWDPDAERQLKARQDAFNLADSVENCVRDKHIVIGCSGRTSLERSAIRALDHGTRVVSASSETYEVDVNALEEISSRKERLEADGRHIGTRFFLRPNDKVVDLVANGYPVNFWGFHSMKDPASDLILTLIMLGTVDIATNEDLEPGIDGSRIDELARDYDLAARFNEIY